MRQRNVKNKKEIIENSKYFIENPKEFKDNWCEVFKNNNPIHKFKAFYNHTQLHHLYCLLDTHI